MEPTIYIWSLQHLKPPHLPLHILSPADKWGDLLQHPQEPLGLALQEIRRKAMYPVPLSTWVRTYAGLKVYLWGGSSLPLYIRKPAQCFTAQS